MKRILITERQLQLIVTNQIEDKKSSRVLTKEQLMSVILDKFDSSKLKAGSTPFKNGKEGDAFRNYVNDSWPNIAKGIDLDRSQPQLYNNIYIQYAYNYNVGGKTLGERFMEQKNQYLPQYSWNTGTSEIPKDKTAQVRNSESGNVVIPNKTEPTKTEPIKITPDDKKVKELEPIKKKIKQYCPTIDSNSNLDVTNVFDASSFMWGGQSGKISNTQNYEAINNNLNSFAEKYINQGIPDRTACEVALNKIRTNYKDKNQIIVDSLNHLIYVFDKDSNFIAKDVIITGAHKQSKDPEILAKALTDWFESSLEAGFEFNYSTGEYTDITGKNRKYNPDLVYQQMEKNGTRFFPPGVYKTGFDTRSNAEYAGGEQNVLDIRRAFDNKEIAVAIHGYFVEPPRIEAFNKAKKVISNPNDPKVSKEFLDEVGLGHINLSQSYGCINVSTEFLPTLRNYMTNAYVFNISEDENNYLVQNTENFFDKTLDKPYCPSPKSLGAEQPINFNMV